ncbi:hypothetical protein [Christiangramia gaetbulicola]|uniref:hypothetical protein n=1 Tax=Christiangramia gaetbulicola TaxID=703340 RepID=UPI000D3B58AA|nr:hypothetical protein [Christiangramia gaetbulicola]
MKKVNYISLIIGLLVQTVFSQVNNNLGFSEAPDSEKIYKTEIDNYQKVLLVQTDNNKYSGFVINKVWKQKRHKKTNDSLIQKIKIPNKEVKELMTKLNKNGFESLIDCYEIENCISGLDGTTITFSFQNSDKSNNASYWELNSDYYYKQNKVELPGEVLKARKIYKIINDKYDLENTFSTFLDRLPKGEYSYGMLIMTKK